MKTYETPAGPVTVQHQEGRVVDIHGPPAAILGLDNGPFVLERATRTSLYNRLQADFNAPPSGPWRGYVDEIDTQPVVEGGFSVG